MAKIRMGNDEFILYLRKNNPTTKTNDVLGREIFQWIIQHDPSVDDFKHDQQCRWGNSGSFVADDNLPKTATQFEFDISLLSELYSFLNTL